jgi:hypothetical protein
MRKGLRQLLVVSASKLNEQTFKRIILNAVKEQESDVLDLQKDQLNAGLLDKGDAIEPPYAPFTVQKKKKKGQDADRVTLRDTGSFYNKQYVKFHRESFEITSRDRKTQKLKRKYDGRGRLGGDVFGLTDESKMLLGRAILPLIQHEVRDRLFKKRT